MFAFAAGVAAVSGILFGLAPMLRAVKTDVSAGMKKARAPPPRTAAASPESPLVVFQVALSLVLVVSAGLFVRTLVNLYSVNPGFDAHNLLLIDIEPPSSRYPAPADVLLHYRIEQAIAGVPGVESVALAEAALVANNVSDTDFIPTDVAKQEGKDYSAYVNLVSQDFFSTMRIPIVEGRGFLPTDSETAPKVAVINQALVKKFYLGQNPIGKTFYGEGGDSKKIPIEIVGISADASYDSLRHSTARHFLHPISTAD